MSDWLDTHLETFVKPVLGIVPRLSEDLRKSHWIIQSLNERQLYSLLKLWSKGKERADGRPILLAGRDAYLFEICARMENFPTIFRPDISTATAEWVKEDYTMCYLLDSGHQGTVPKRMNMKHYGLINCSIAADKKDHQIFPTDKENAPYVNLYGTFEGASKYWTRGSIALIHPLKPVSKDNVIITQGFENKLSFTSAAQITIHIAQFIHRVNEHQHQYKHSVCSIGRGL